MFTATRLLLLASAALAFGPPSITVTAVSGKSAPTPGAVFLIRSDHHHDEYPLTAKARAEGIVNGRRVTQPIALRAVPGKEATWTATSQWSAGTPWVLVFTIEQGDHGKYGVAEALVRVAADGRVLGIEPMRASNERGGSYARAAEAKEVEAALASLTRGT
ncbi:MAG: hypothetical protein V9E87_03415 [Gemmatimonadales bacterium]